jgi:hypothetical protein
LPDGELKLAMQRFEISRKKMLWFFKYLLFNKLI